MTVRVRRVLLDAGPLVLESEGDQRFRGIGNRPILYPSAFTRASDPHAVGRQCTTCGAGARPGEWDRKNPGCRQPVFPTRFRRHCFCAQSTGRCFTRRRFPGVSRFMEYSSIGINGVVAHSRGFNERTYSRWRQRHAASAFDDQYTEAGRSSRQLAFSPLSD